MCAKVLLFRQLCKKNGQKSQKNDFFSWKIWKIENFFVILQRISIQNVSRTENRHHIVEIMYSPTTVERLMREQKKNASDMAEFIYGNRRRSVVHLLKEGANPTAELIEKVADFLGVSIDEIFGRYNPRTAEDRDVELMEKLIRSYEAQLNMSKEQIELLKLKIKLLQMDKNENE